MNFFNRLKEGIGSAAKGMKEGIRSAAKGVKELMGAKVTRAAVAATLGTGAAMIPDQAQAHPMNPAFATPSSPKGFNDSGNISFGSLGTEIPCAIVSEDGSAYVVSSKPQPVNPAATRPASAPVRRTTPPPAPKPQIKPVVAAPHPTAADDDIVILDDGDVMIMEEGSNGSTNPSAIGVVSTSPRSAETPVAATVQVGPDTQGVAKEYNAALLTLAGLGLAGAGLAARRRRRQMKAIDTELERLEAEDAEWQDMRERAEEDRVEAAALQEAAASRALVEAKKTEEARALAEAATAKREEGSGVPTFFRRAKNVSSTMKVEVKVPLRYKAPVQVQPLRRRGDSDVVKAKEGLTRTSFILKLESLIKADYRSHFKYDVNLSDAEMAKIWMDKLITNEYTPSKIAQLIQKLGDKDELSNDLMAAFKNAVEDILEDGLDIEFNDASDEPSGPIKLDQFTEEIKLSDPKQAKEYFTKKFVPGLRQFSGLVRQANALYQKISQLDGQDRQACVKLEHNGRTTVLDDAGLKQYNDWFLKGLERLLDDEYDVNFDDDDSFTGFLNSRLASLNHGIHSLQALIPQLEEQKLNARLERSIVESMVSRLKQMVAEGELAHITDENWKRLMDMLMAKDPTMWAEEQKGLIVMAFGQVKDEMAAFGKVHAEVMATLDRFVQKSKQEAKARRIASLTADADRKMQEFAQEDEEMEKLFREMTTSQKEAEKERMTTLALYPEIDALHADLNALEEDLTKKGAKGARRSAELRLMLSGIDITGPVISLDTEKEQFNLVNGVFIAYGEAIREARRKQSDTQAAETEKNPENSAIAGWRLGVTSVLDQERLIGLSGAAESTEVAVNETEAPAGSTIDMILEKLRSKREGKPAAGLRAASPAM